jgi:hypothetical protein
VGRWKAEEFPLWGGRYLRFWVVQRILRARACPADLESWMR